MLALLLATHLTAAATGVSPQTRAEAARLVHESMGEYDLGHFERALAAAEQAYRLDPLPQILFNLGQCQRALHHWDQAAFFFRRYLEKLPKAPNRKLAQDLLAEADAKAEADAHRAPGEEAGGRSLREPAPVEVPLVMGPAAAAPGLAPPVGAGEPSPAPAAAVGLGAPAPARRSHGLGIGLLAGGVVAAAAAVVAQVEVQTALADRNAVRSPALNSNYTRIGHEEEYGPIWLTVSIVTGVLAAAGIAGGIATW